MAVKLDSKVYNPPHTVPPITVTYRTVSAKGKAKGNEPHFHPDTIEMSYIARGHLDWWMEDEAFEVHSGDLLLVPQGAAHGSVDSALQPCEIYTIHIAPEALSPAVRSVALSFGGRYVRSPEMGSMVKEIFDEHDRGDSLLPDVVAARAVLLIAFVARFTARRAEGKRSAIVREAQKVLLGEDGVSCTVAQAAERLNISSVWLNRLFQQELGESPGDWVRSRRMAEAKRLLAFEGASVTEIAIRLGYGSSQYFATAFRHECGMTPSAYRAQCAGTPSAGSVVPISAPMR